MMTFTDTLKPRDKSLGIAFDFLLVLAGSFLIALSAQLAIPLPFTPIPVSMQSFAILMVGGLVGAKKGFAAVLTYIAQGCLGLPVFAGGVAGFANLIGPRGGYLLGFLAAAFVIGFIIQKMGKKSVFKLFTSFLIADLTILVLGGLWLSLFVGATHAFSLGIAPFLLGELTKVTLLTLMFSKLRTK